MTVQLQSCSWCNRDFFPNQIKHTANGNPICRDCASNTGRDDLFATHGEIQANRRAAAQATAWNNGNGYGEEATKGERE